MGGRKFHHGDLISYLFIFFQYKKYLLTIKNGLTLIINPLSSLAIVPAASAPDIGGGALRRGGTEGMSARGHPPPGARRVALQQIAEPQGPGG